MTNENPHSTIWEAVLRKYEEKWQHLRFLQGEVIISKNLSNVQQNITVDEIALMAWGCTLAMHFTTQKVAHF